ncbi:hypothetical protein DFH28DRAFT_456897 [Melampsora americana]|nr:hypothetical protein DFH28DRAFT_456897 [Melampsora americana]
MYCTGVPRIPATLSTLMGSTPSPGQLRSIHTISTSDIGIRVRIAGRVLKSRKGEWTILIGNNLASIEVDCTIPMSAATLTDNLPRTGEQWMIMGDIIPMPNGLCETKVLPQVGISAVLLKQVPHLDLLEWDKAVQEEIPTKLFNT